MDPSTDQYPKNKIKIILNRDLSYWLSNTSLMSEKCGALRYANVTGCGSGWRGEHLIVLHIVIPFAGAMNEYQEASRKPQHF